MRGYVIMDNTICQGDIIAGWVCEPNAPGMSGPEAETPEIYRDPRNAAKSILNDRIDWLQSRIENLNGDPLDDNGDELLDECNGEASDDQDFWIEAVDIEGEGSAAVITWVDSEVSLTLSEASRNAGRAPGQAIIWNADGSSFADATKEG